MNFPDGWPDAAGISPLIVSRAGDTMGEFAKTGGTVGVQFWPLGTMGQPVGFMAQQEFEVFAFTFHNYRPPEGWLFVEEGPYPPP
jgi:hypothetical protein